MADTPSLHDDFEDLSVTIDGKVAVLTLNRPEQLNAFSRAMGQSLTAALRAADADDDIRVVILTGAGRAFCAGADFSGGAGVFGTPTKETFSSDPLDDFHPWDVRKPVIAAINGHAVGLGLTMPLQCDIRIVANEAKLGIVQTRRGILPDLHSHWTLPRLVGHTRATEIMLTGRMFRGTDALEWGLATEALPADEVLPRALELAHEMATHTAPISVGASKRLLWMSAPAPGEINDLERDIHLHLMGTADSKEGVMAFMEKRDPEWSLKLSEDWPEWLNDAR
jgi:enoyl-CoA hydratase/carnithine racemase